MAKVEVTTIRLDRSLPDWNGDHLVLPEAGYIPPAFSYTFFPQPQEALLQVAPKELVEIIKRQPYLTSRFLHELIAKGRETDAKEVVGLLGDTETATNFINNDCHRALVTMTDDFVPGDEIQRFIVALHKLGLSNIKDDMWNRPRIDQNRLTQVREAAPTRDTLGKYVEKYNTGHLNRDKRVQNTNDLRIIDPRRNLRYVGLGNTGKYDWVYISTADGLRQDSHYTAPDLETKIALLSVY